MKMPDSIETLVTTVSQICNVLVGWSEGRCLSGAAGVLARRAPKTSQSVQLREAWPLRVLSSFASFTAPGWRAAAMDFSAGAPNSSGCK
jgi:hypothetical protein